MDCMTREVEATFDGPTIVCPRCTARIAVATPTGWTVRSPRDVYAHLGAELGALEREELRVLLLNTKNVVLRSVTAYRGNVSSAQVRVAELLRDAVRETATAIMLVHNHPRGDPTPSPDDLHLTAEVLAAARLLDIDLLDHVIVTAGGYASLRERGVSFDRAGAR